MQELKMGDKQLKYGKIAATKKEEEGHERPGDKIIEEE